MGIPTSITQLSTTAINNSPAGSDAIGNPGQIDDYFRGYGAIQRAESLNKSWERWNDTPTYISATQFSVATDLTARYVANRRIKCTVTAGTVYGYIVSSAFGSVTTVTVGLDSGALDAGLSEVQLGPENNAALQNPRFTGIVTGTYFAVYGAATVHTAGPGSGAGFIEWNRSGSAGELAILNYKGGGTGSIIFGTVTNLNAATTQLTLTDDGRLYGSALHNNAGAVTGTVNQYIASGTYTPTLTPVTGITSSTARNCKWIRVGNVVFVSGTASITASGTTGSQFRTTLPIASTVGLIYDLSGSGVEVNGLASAKNGVAISPGAGNTAQFEWLALGTIGADIRFTFHYEVL